ncbi:MAG: peptide chain release factor N(5)-glutamine methyltransferase [Lachnospiraceae bacterium]|nr:peptide chain release factor N(5)-glutamine methyltransferase [Lachnospiraceae bacterium]
MLSYREAAVYGEKKLAEAGVEEARLDARLLLEQVCNTQRQELYLHPDRLLSAEEEKLYSEFLERRSGREPLQYILGKQFFFGEEYAVSPAVLIPRADTECLVEKALSFGVEGKQVLDLCTGSGCILFSVLKRAKGSSGVGTDLSKEALEQAEKNREKLQVDAKLYYGDLFEALPEELKGSFDFLLSNPPYIPSGEIEELMPEVSRFEPRMALDGGADGLELYRRIAGGAGEWLKSGGRILLEIGSTQAEELAALLEAAGFSETEVIKDHAGLDRVVCAIYTR